MLSQAILRRRTKFGFETPQARWLCDGLRPTIEAWLAGDAPLWKYADRNQARQTAERVWATGGRIDEPAQELMRLFLADRWMRVFFG
jgi:hypothetical protein